MTQINSFSARVLQYMQTNKATKESAQEAVKEEIEREKENGQETPDDYKENNEESMQTLDYQAAMNSLLINNVANKTDTKTYTLKSTAKTTIMVNGKKVTVTASGATSKKTIKITVDNEGKINIENNGATGITFSTTENLQINISKSTANFSLIGGSGNDIITVQEGVKISKIDGGKGNDIIVNNGADNTSASILGGAGNDIIINNSKVKTLSADAGNDTIINLSSASIIQGTSGTNTIENMGTVTSITGGTGTDNINNFGTVKNINAGKGNDTIINNGKITGNVNGEAGTDTFIQNENALLKGKLTAENKTIADYTSVNGIIYKDNKVFTGINPNDDKYYEKGKLSTGEKIVDGFWFKDGIKAGTATVETEGNIRTINYFNLNGNNVKIIKETRNSKGEVTNKTVTTYGTVKGLHATKTTTYEKGKKVNYTEIDDYGRVLTKNTYKYNSKGKLSTTTETSYGYKGDTRTQIYTVTTSNGNKTEEYKEYDAETGKLTYHKKISNTQYFLAQYDAVTGKVKSQTKASRSGGLITSVWQCEYNSKGGEISKITYEAKPHDCGIYTQYENGKKVFEYLDIYVGLSSKGKGKAQQINIDGSWMTMQEFLSRGLGW